MFCTHCGHQLPEGTRFCGHCGHAVHADPESATHPIGAPPGAASAARTARDVWIGVRPTTEQVVGDIRAVGIAVICQLVLSLAAVLVIALLLPPGDRGGPFTWGQGAVLLGGLSQRAAVTAQAGMSFLIASGDVSAAAIAPPLTVTLLVLLPLGMTAWWSARRQPSRGVGATVLRSTMAAGFYAVLWGFLGVLGHGKMGLGALDTGYGTAAVIGLSLWSTLWHCFVAGALIVALPHFWGLIRRLPSLRARTAPVRHALLGAASVTVLSWVAVALVAIGWGIYGLVSSTGPPAEVSAAVEETPTDGLQAVTALLALALALLLNVVSVGGAVLLGSSVTYDLHDHGTDLASQVPGGQSVGIFLGSGSTWWVLVPLALWCLTSVIGARVGVLALPSRVGLRLLALYVCATLAVFLGCAALSRLVLRVSVTSSLDSPAGSGWLLVSAGVGWRSTILVSMVAGAALWVGHRFLLPVLAAAYPRRVAAVVGRRMHPAWALRLADAVVRTGQEPQPWLARMADDAAHLRVHPLTLGRRRLKVLGGAVGAATLVAAGLIAGAHWLSTSVYGPRAVASTYAEGYASGDAESALDAVTPRSKAPTLTSSALDHELKQHPVSDIEVHLQEETDDYAAVKLSYAQDGERVERVLTLVPDDSSTAPLGLFRTWKVAAGALSMVSLDSAAHDWGALGDVTVLGQRVEPNGESTAFPVFPGTVDVSTSGEGPWAAVQRTVAVDADEPAVVTLPLTLRDQAEQEVRQTVTDRLETCAEAHDLAPAGCPFNTYSFGDPLNVRWKVLGKPDLTVTADEYGDILTEGTCDLRVTYVDKTPWGADEQSENVVADLTGSASYDGASATVTFDYANPGD